MEDVLGPLLESMLGRIAQGTQRRAEPPLVENTAIGRNTNQEMYATTNYEYPGRRHQHPGGDPYQPTQHHGLGHRIENRTSTPIQINNRVEQRPPSVADNNRNDFPIPVRSIEQPNYDRTNKVPINKWPIRFSGESKGMSVEEFLKRVDVLARNNQVSETELLSKANFLFRPESPAEIWYYTFSHKFTNWQMLKYYLRLRFEVPNKDKVIEREIRDRKQMPNETFVTYMGEIERLCQQLSKPMSERTKKSIMLDNMRDWYRPHLAFIDTEAMDIETLCNLCYELDKSVYRSYAQRSRPFNVHCVDEQNYGEDLEDEDPEINAITRNRPRNPKVPDERREINPEQINAPQNTILCWNCRQFGHYWRDCPKNKRLFCHICGQPEVVVMNCPGNHRHQQTEAKNERMEGN